MPLVIDAQIAGISGDMLLCSLVHMGADASKISSALRRAASNMPGQRILDIGFERVKKHGLESTRLVLEMSRDLVRGDASAIEDRISKIVDSEGLSADAGSFARASIGTLIDAESSVHGVERKSVHLHEAASLDTVVDIVGTAIALDDLGLFSERIVCTPVAVGGGTLTFSHGTTSNPAGAILEILRGRNIEICGGPTDVELTTPTGASMLVNLASECARFYPPMSPTQVGYGAGSADHEGFANVLKVVWGSADSALAEGTVRVLETNLDDVTGEVIAHVIDALMRRGALDVTVSPGITKKGRPTSLVTVMCDADSYGVVLSTLIDETGTLGVRVRDSARVVVHRASEKTSVTVGGRTFEVRYKTALGRAKIEHDDVARVASDLGVPLWRARSMLDDAMAGGVQ